MAIDSARKRASALYFVGHRKGRLLPDGAISGADRQDMVGFYRGVTGFGLLATVTLLSATVSQPAITASLPAPTVTISTPGPTITITEKNDIT